MKPINRNRSTKHVALFSGNGNQPKMNTHFSFMHFEIHFHDVFALVKIALLILATFWWLDTFEEGNE